MPDVVLLADVRDLVDGVEGAVDGGARGAVDEEREVAGGLVPDDQVLQLGRDHAAPEKRGKKMGMERLVRLSSSFQIIGSSAVTVFPKREESFRLKNR